MLWLAVFLDVAVATPPSPSPAWHAPCRNALADLRTELVRIDPRFYEARILAPPDKLHFVSISAGGEYELDVAPRRREDVPAFDTLWVHANGTSFEFRMDRGLLIRYNARGPHSPQFLARAEKVSRVCIDAAPRPAWMLRCQSALREHDATVDDTTVSVHTKDFDLRIRERGREPDSVSWSEPKPKLFTRTTDELVAFVTGSRSPVTDRLAARCLDARY